MPSSKNKTTSEPRTDAFRDIRDITKQSRLKNRKKLKNEVVQQDYDDMISASALIESNGSIKQMTRLLQKASHLIKTIVIDAGNNCSDSN